MKASTAHNGAGRVESRHKQGDHAVVDIAFETTIYGGRSTHVVLKFLTYGVITIYTIYSNLHPRRFRSHNGSASDCHAGGPVFKLP